MIDNLKTPFIDNLQIGEMTKYNRKTIYQKLNQKDNGIIAKWENEEKKGNTCKDKRLCHIEVPYLDYPLTMWACLS